MTRSCRPAVMPSSASALSTSAGRCSGGILAPALRHQHGAHCAPRWPAGWRFLQVSSSYGRRVTAVSGQRRGACSVQISLATVPSSASTQGRQDSETGAAAPRVSSASRDALLRNAVEVQQAAQRCAHDGGAARQARLPRYARLVAHDEGAWPQLNPTLRAELPEALADRLQGRPRQRPSPGAPQALFPAHERGVRLGATPQQLQVSPSTSGEAASAPP